ncbi:hypothetical protein [Glycomyces xiaoerkulensis]|uniref:hypothetical protein n=1 Tax=Glycomyces xiaoerkulensis TaxID=2038139 RepID=UPI0012FFE246|nr:hypothetical protein [Glycomyces xiaoerkulensis]
MRTLKLAGIAAVGLGALTACSSSMQGAAMFVGDERITENTIDGYVDEIADLTVEESGGALEDFDYGANREQVVIWVMLSEIGQREDLSEPDTSQATSELHGLFLEAEGYSSQIYEGAEPRELTDAEIEAMSELGTDFTELRPADQESLMQMAGISDALSGYIEDYDVRVNPRYGVESFDIGSEELDGLFEVEIPQR